MRVLIITYYWPPSGGSGVQRWLKTVKYLRNFGIEPVIYTVDNPDYALEDFSLLKEIPEGIEVLKQPIWEPYKLSNFFVRKKGVKTQSGFLSKKQSLFGKLANYIRANYFIPDARMFWIKPSINYLEKYLQENPVDAIVSTGPPHSMHLIAQALKAKTNIPWISDFRDPWTAIDYFHQLPLTEKAKKKHFTLEQKVLQQSDAVLVVGKQMQKDYLPWNKKTFVIPNGFDGDLEKAEIQLNSKFSISHIGLMNDDRNPKILWQVLQQLINEEKGFAEDLQIQLVGKIASEVILHIENCQLKNYLEQIDYLPHSEVQLFQQKTQVLLLVVNNVPSAKGIITGKIFEYLLAKRPILAIGPEDGDLAEILTETQGGIIVDYENYEKLKTSILQFYRQYKTGNLNVSSKNIEKYHRIEITGNIAQLIKDVVNK